MKKTSILVLGLFMAALLLSACGGAQSFPSGTMAISTDFGVVESPKTDIASQILGGSYTLSCKENTETWFWATPGVYNEYKTFVSFVPEVPDKVFVTISKDGKNPEAQAEITSTGGFLNKFAINDLAAADFDNYVTSLDVPNLIVKLMVEQEATHKNFSCYKVP